LNARVLVAVAHPDDETVGAGALLSRLPDVWVVHATDGIPRDPRFIARGFRGTPEEYGRVRRRELEAAMALAGIGPDRLLTLNAPDQEAVFALPRLVREMTALIRRLAPSLVLTLAYEGGHPDHDAVALAVRTAIDGLEDPPELMEMALYHAVPGMGRMVIGEPLPDHGSPESRIPLTDEERALKARMIAAFATQRETLQAFLPPRDEVFRPAPDYDFTQPPHPGHLQYELWNFPITGAEWRKEARLAFSLQV
jgi:LmbE family N-acetylglucosaminyl deacetylase